MRCIPPSIPQMPAHHTHHHHHHHAHLYNIDLHAGDLILWDCVPVPVTGPGSLCPPRRLPLRPLCLRRQRQPPPPAAKAAASRAGSALGAGGGWLVLGSGGLGGWGVRPSPWWWRCTGG